MKKIFFLFSILSTMLTSCTDNAPSKPTTFDQYPVYQGTDLGLTYTAQQSTLKVWSPAIDDLRIHLYKDGLKGAPIETRSLKLGKDGVWSITLKGDWKGKFYTFQALHNDTWLNEVPDPYAKAVGANGKRAMFIDLQETNPKGWNADKRPPLEHFKDIVIYEIHVRDASIHSSSGIQNKGKFLGLAEAGTRSPQGETTGLDHLKELGVTHLHLLPSFDFLPRSVDETNPNAKYNWGYDPQNYNVPEGAYATDPYDGNVRIREFKEMVKTLHDTGLRVILDVVYNHTGETETSNFNQIAPGYYYRHNEDGSFSNASACGNETASDRPMMRKFMLESMKYWVEEYHLDGFRVDLMGIHDLETMNQIAEELHKIDPTIFIYGEGWTAGDSPLPVEQRAIKHNTPRLKGVAAFSDDLRDALKGSVFEIADRGFVSGKTGTEESIKFGIVASTRHPQVNYAAVNYSKEAWANQPDQTISYVSCHDNHTLYDKLALSCKDADEAARLQMNRLANAIVLTSQGVPFLHAGVDFARTKNGVENSFESSDTINQIDWNRKTTYRQHFDFYKKLIQLRKEHPAFRLRTTDQIVEHLEFLPLDTPLLVGYQLKNNANGDAWKNIIVVYNGGRNARNIDLPEGNWTLVAEGDRLELNGIKAVRGKQASVPAIGLLILAEQ